MKGLKSRLYLLIFLVALPGIVAISLHAFQDRNQVVETYKSQAVETARRLAAAQAEIIERTQSYLAYLATVNEIQDPSSPLCSQFLSNVLELNTTYVNLGVPKPDGDLLCNALPLKKKINVFDRAYFQHSLLSKSFAIGTYQHDRAAQTTSINFSYPVLTPLGEVAGVVVAVVSLDWWSKTLFDYRLPDGSIALISDENNIVVANFPVDIEAQGDAVEVYNFFLEQSRTYDLDTKVVKGADGITRIYTHKTLYKKSNGKSVIVSVGIPITQAINDANFQLFFDLFVFVIFLLVVTLFAVRQLKASILNPLSGISEATENLKQGRFYSRLDMKGATEISILARRFESMAQARLKAEEASKKRTDELDSIFNALPDLYFKMDAKGTILDYRAMDDMDLYVDPSEFLGGKMQDVLPPEIGLEFERRLRDLSAGDGQSTWEYPLAVEGKIQFFEMRMNSISNSSDVIAVVRNITEDKEKEEYIRLAASVFEHSSECMVVTDPDGIIVNVNPAFTKIMGYQLEEVKGATTKILESGYHQKEFYSDLWDRLKASGHWEGEIYNRQKNGEIVVEWMAINAIYDDANKVVQYVALYRDISEQKKATELIWKQAHYDHLTNLPNRITLLEHLDHEIVKAQRSDTTIASLFLDLDEFKDINDSLGHDKGDLLLKLVAERLQFTVRSEDLISRQGGDEFIIVMAELQDINPAIRVADQLIQVFSEPFNLDSDVVYVTVSIGISFYPQNASNTAELLKTSDQAMYVAKSLGRNGFQCFTQEMQDLAIQKVQLVRDLNRATEAHQFQLVFQPIVSLDDAKLLKAEALIRWNHPERGLLSPDYFIPIAEETRLISKLGDWVFEEACRALSAIHKLAGQGFQLSINVSPVQFSDSESYVAKWPERLKQLQIAGSSIVIEITEGLLMNSDEVSLSALLGFRDAGIQVSLDDFGTGYSSLAYIREYDIDYLKIDRQFVTNLPGSSDSYTLCESIIVMAHKLGIKVIAEGVETEAQRDALKDMGCDYAQGYLFSKPLPLDDFLALCRSY